MFEFGDPVEIARTWVEEASATGGTGLTGLHYEDLEENQLRDLFIYLRIAYFRASRDGASDEVMEILLRWYDEVFLYLLTFLDGFRMLVCSRIHQPVTDRNRYWEWAGCGSAN